MLHIVVSICILKKGKKGKTSTHKFNCKQLQDQKQDQKPQKEQTESVIGPKARAIAGIDTGTKAAKKTENGKAAKINTGTVT